MQDELRVPAISIDVIGRQLELLRSRLRSNATFEPNCHDLLRVDPEIALGRDTPGWIAAALARAPWVVVRRARATGGIPVGIRGWTRAQRFAARVVPSDVFLRLTPSDLVSHIVGSNPQPSPTRSRPIDAAAQSVRATADRLEIAWGPAGAYGFELASGVAVTHPASDLDIVIFASALHPRTRQPVPPHSTPSLATLREFAACCTQIQANTDVRIDAEVLAGDSGVALHELISDAASVIMKTNAGPLLISRSS